MTCEDPPPPELVEGIRQFNAREFYECHETLETIWLAEPGEIRLLYQGILQIGVAFFHHGRGNFRGCTSLLQSGIGYVQRFSPTCMTVNVQELVEASIRCYAALESLGRDRMMELDPGMLPEIRFVES